MSTYLFLLLVLVCPLIMLFMMRGHGHGGHSDSHAGEPASLDDLRRRRDELSQQIAAREAARKDGSDAAVTEA